MNQPDQAILDQIARKQQLVLVRVREVARGRVASFFIHGPGGHGKSHMIIEELDSILGRGNWHHHNSSLSVPGMKKLLRDHPRSLHLFEDAESSFDREMSGILRSACGRVAGSPALIAPANARDSTPFQFFGGIIIASNENLANDRIMGAVASRMRPRFWHLLPEEMKAIILNAAAKGIELQGEVVTADEAIEVAEFVCEFMEGGNNVDLRSYFEHAIPSYLNWKYEETVERIKNKARAIGFHPEASATVHWRELVRSKLEEQVEPETREQRLVQDRVTACQCYRDGKDTEERIALWTMRTSYGKQTFYNRIKEAKANGLFQQMCG